MLRCRKFSFGNSSGFTLLEVIITIGILTSMMIAISTLLRGSFDVRAGLSNQAKITHRINTAMRSVSEDLAHAFIISSKDTIREGAGRTLFEIKNSSKSDTLRFTMTNHTPMRQNAKESDMAFVVYEVRESKKVSGRSHLYRGLNSVISSSFKEDPKMNVIAKHIKGASFEYWNGDGWTDGKWDSTSSDTRDKIPHMVRVTIEAWVEDPFEDEPREEIHEATVKYSTIVYLNYAYKFGEMKTKSSSLKL